MDTKLTPTFKLLQQARQNTVTMIQERNLSVLLAASALASLVEQPQRVENKCLTPKVTLSQTKEPLERTTKTLTFPQKLMRVLSSEEYSNIITWLPRGRSFAIINPREFVSVVLPAHFKRVKYSSFTRKLHRWGFQRKTRGEEAGAFYHKLFRRDNADLCTEMSMNKSECYHGKYAEAKEKILITSTPLLDKSIRESEKAGYGPKSGPSSRRQESQVCLPKSMDSCVDDNHKNIPIDQNMLDQFILSRRMRAMSRATSLSGHALRSMHPLQLNAGLQNDEQANPVDGKRNTERVRTTSRYFDKNYQKSDGCSSEGLGALRKGARKGEVPCLSNMVPPSA